MKNVVNLIGRVGKDPEVTRPRDNMVVAKFSIATTEKWKDRNGEKQEKTTWHRIITFGKLAEVVEKYVKKGNLLDVEGKIDNGEYTDDQNIKRYTSDVVVNNMIMLPSGSDGTKQAPKDAPTPTPTPADTADSGFDDEIPF